MDSEALGQITRTLEVPAGMQGDREHYYNPKTRIIVLDGPRGPLLAHVTGSTSPDPTRHRFLCCFPRDYTIFDGLRVPDIIRADITAIAWPIENLRDKRVTVTSGAMPSVSASDAPGPEDELFTAGDPARVDVAAQSGLRLGPQALEAHFDGGGLSIDKDGVAIAGALRQEEPTDRGVTRESPLWGVIPKTIGTFPFVDYLPDVETFLSYAALAQQGYQAIKALRNLVKQLRAMD